MGGTAFFFSRLCQHFAQYILPHIFHSILIPESSKDADYSILILFYPTENRCAENQKNFRNHWPRATGTATVDLPVL